MTDTLRYTNDGVNPELAGSRPVFPDRWTNRRKAVEALRAGVESERAIGKVLERDDNGQITGKCACAFIAQGLGIDLETSTFAQIYNGIFDKIDFPVEHIYSLNDAQNDEGEPLYTLPEIGNILGAIWSVS